MIHLTDWNKTIIESPARLINASEAFGSLDINENEDIMYIGFTLCHEGVNTNGDRFTLEEMKKSWRTIVHKPINWEHTEPNIGVVLDSALKTPEIGEASENNKVVRFPAQIDCVGSIWGIRYPEYAALLTQGSSDDSLRVSMEAYFKDCDYVIGEFDEVIPKDEAPEDIKYYLGTYAKKFNNKFVSRALKSVIFGGVGVTVCPADKEARIWACASNKSDEEYHQYLHDVYEGRKLSVMTREQVISEHEKVTLKLINKFEGRC